MHHVYRQRSSLGLAGVSGGTGLILLVSLARGWGDYPRPLFAAWAVFWMAVAWSVFFRPAVLIDRDGVLIRNVLRDIRIPWALLSDVRTRWSLSLSVEDKNYTAWALSSQAERPRRTAGGMFRMPVPGRLEGVSSADASVSRRTGTRSGAVTKVTAQSVAWSIRAAKQEYDQAVDQGDLTASDDAMVRITWVPLAIAALLLPAIAVVALTLG